MTHTVASSDNLWRSSHADGSMTRSRGWIGALLIAGACLGCGSENEPSETVPPPAADSPPEAGDVSGKPAGASPEVPEETGANSGALPADAEPNRRKGGFELPPGEIPAESSDPSDTPSSRGLRMPETDSTAPDSSTDPSSADETSAGDQEQPPAGGAAASGSELDLQYASWQSTQQAATRSGKITVVDLWALSCQPCLKEFPGLVRLKERFGDSTRCIGFNVDFDGRKTRPPESYEEDIAKFLRAVGAEFPNYISKTPSLDVFADVGIDSIPAVLVFDRQGELVQRFADTGEDAGFTYEQDIIPLVAKLADRDS